MKSWSERIVEIPGILRAAHGLRCTCGELAVVYGGGFLLAFLVLYFGRLELEGLASWQLLIVSLLAFGISAGALANLTKGTSNYWHEKSFAKRLGFILLHITHPALLWLVFPQYLAVLALAFGLMLFSFIIISIIGKGKFGEPLAMAFALADSCLLIFVWGGGFIVTFLMMEYFFELVFGFSPDRRDSQGIHPDP